MITNSQIPYAKSMCKSMGETDRPMGTMRAIGNIMSYLEHGKPIDVAS